jgi:hypothetical protein
MLVRARREERLPEFRSYAEALAESDGSGTALANATDFIGLSVDDALRRTLASSGGPMRELNFVAYINRWSAAMSQPNDLSRSLVPLDQDVPLTARLAHCHVCSEDRLTDPIAAAQPYRQELVFMPHGGHKGEESVGHCNQTGCGPPSITRRDGWVAASGCSLNERNR